MSRRGADLQQAQLHRVADRIAAAIVSFCEQRIGRCFYMEELREYVHAVQPSAPESPGRILRYLRADGDVDYKVLSRNRSLYFVVSVRSNEERLRQLIDTTLRASRGRQR